MREAAPLSPPAYVTGEPAHKLRRMRSGTSAFPAAQPRVALPPPPDPLPPGLTWVSFPHGLGGKKEAALLDEGLMKAVKLPVHGGTVSKRQ